MREGWGTELKQQSMKIFWTSQPSLSAIINHAPALHGALYREI